MSKPNLSEILRHEHETRKKERQQPLSEEAFRGMVFKSIADNYRQCHPEIMQEHALRLVQMQFQEVADRMYDSYLAGHHKLNDYVLALKGVPKDARQ